MAQCLEKYSNINNYALNPTLNETYATIEGILHDINGAMSNAHYLHLGMKYFYMYGNYYSNIVFLLYTISFLSSYTLTYIL